MDIGKSIHAQWPTGGQSLAHIDHICAHMSAVYHLTPPGDGEATPGDMAVQGAAPPGDTASLGAPRGWPLPPPCAGYRTHYMRCVDERIAGGKRTGTRESEVISN